MADQSPNATAKSLSATAVAKPKRATTLGDGEIRRGVELLYFGYSHLTRSIDAGLAVQGLGRAHHRALYFMARQPGLTVSDLLKLLNITKQSLSRVVNDLIARELITLKPGSHDRRQRHMMLSEKGAALEAELFCQLREKLSAAYGRAGEDSVPGFWHILEGLIPEDERDRVFALSR
jgi:DNA-binding MarR family transcriptional regulator